jgi:hypothetical protein
MEIELGTSSIHIVVFVLGGVGILKEEAGWGGGGGCVH